MLHLAIMNHRSRQVIAVTLVAAALCADRVAGAAPALRPQPRNATAAERLVERLTTSFRRAVPAARVIAVRRDESTVETRLPAPQAIVLLPQPTVPFQFRLPPPLA
jgi:hypothetical protein